jgi:hypothetical protein
MFNPNRKQKMESESLTLNITKAIEKAEEQKISQIQVESRHYTIFHQLKMMLFLTIMMMKLS